MYHLYLAVSVTEKIRFAEMEIPHVENDAPFFLIPFPECKFQLIVMLHKIFPGLSEKNINTNVFWIWKKRSLFIQIGYGFRKKSEIHM